MNQNLLEDIKIKSIPILKKAEIKKAALFGSYVRGDNTSKSDIDFLISFPEEATLLDMVRLKRNLERRLKNKVDIVSFNGISPLLKQSILSNQYPIL